MAFVRHRHVLTGDAGTYNVVIIGGGVAGACTALALLLQGVGNILILESGDYGADRLGESLPPNIRMAFDRLSISQDFANQKHEPCYGSCSVWGRAEPGFNDFLLNPLGHGWHVDRRGFDQFLANLAVSRGAKLWTQTRYRRAQTLPGGGLRLHVSTTSGPGGSIDAGFVVDASGHNGRFASDMGAKRLQLDQLFFAAAYFRLPEAFDFPRQTLLEAVDYGWWYAALLPNHRAVVNIATDLNIIRQRKLNLQAGLLDSLKQTQLIASRPLAAHFEPDSLRVRTLPVFQLDNPTGDNWIAVGDAASAFDPLSSQGIYKAVADGSEASRLISAKLSGMGDQSERYRRYIAKNFDDFVRNRNYFYSQEQRWPQSPFWLNRWSAGRSVAGQPRAA